MGEGDAKKVYRILMVVYGTGIIPYNRKPAEMSTPIDMLDTSDLLNTHPSINR